MQTMYIAKAKDKEKMQDKTDLYEILGVVKPEEAAIKKEDGKCKLESYPNTPVYFMK
jgi:hypothetical protein